MELKNARARKEGAMAALQDKVAIVTGGASGIGEATVALFHKEGASVVIADINRERADALAERLKTRALAHHCDVTKAKDWDGLVAATLAAFGKLDVLVNDAGTGFTPALIEDEDPQHHRALLDLNLTGVWAGMRAVLPQMKRQGGGSIVNVSSIDGLVGVPHMTTYVATKFAVTGMTQSVALEAGRDGVRVNSVHPGVIGTPLVMRSAPEKRTRLNDSISRQPIPRMGRPEEIAQAILFFASDASSYCTGTSLVVDGGHLAGPPRLPPD
jgi:3alpha(or 20beta)-hydroxysteroid dehydrogenase